MTTATTRPQRPSEQHGREHFFVSRDEFHRMIDQNELLEWQEIHGELYGTPHAPLERAIDAEDDLIADIDVLGANRLRQFYPNNVRLIFIQPPSAEVLKERMQARGESEPEIEKRLRRVTMEMQYAPNCDYLITNDRMSDATRSWGQHWLPMAFPCIMAT
jgi:guanylate kinase